MRFLKPCPRSSWVRLEGYTSLADLFAANLDQVRRRDVRRQTSYFSLSKFDSKTIPIVTTQELVPWPLILASPKKLNL